MAADLGMLYTRGGKIEDVGLMQDLAYDGQTGNFTVGLVVTGGTSGATGTIHADADAGATGTLTLKNIKGTFQNNEAITDTSTGAATVNGVLATPALTPGNDEVVLLVDPVNMTKSDLMDALRQFMHKVTVMDFPALSSGNQG